MTFSFKRVIVVLLVLIPMFFLLVFTSLVVFGADYPGKKQISQIHTLAFEGSYSKKQRFFRLYKQVESFFGKIQCRLEGNKVQNEMMGNWSCIQL